MNPRAIARLSLPLGKQIGEVASLKISRHPDLRFRARQSLWMVTVPVRPS